MDVWGLDRCQQPACRLLCRPSTSRCLSLGTTCIPGMHVMTAPQVLDTIGCEHTDCGCQLPKVVQAMLPATMLAPGAGATPPTGAALPPWDAAAPGPRPPAAAAGQVCGTTSITAAAAAARRSCEHVVSLP